MFCLCISISSMTTRWFRFLFNTLFFCQYDLFQHVLLYEKQFLLLKVLVVPLKFYSFQVNVV
eukprot:UN03679